MPQNVGSKGSEALVSDKVELLSFAEYLRLCAQGVDPEKAYTTVYNEVTFEFERKKDADAEF